MRTKKTQIRRLAALCALSACALLGAGAEQAIAAVPVVVNDPASSITDTSATLNGTVTTDSALTDCHFEFVDPTVTEGDTSFADLSSGGEVPCAQAPGSIPLNTPTQVSATIPLPSPGAPYYFRLAATNASGTEFGAYWVGFGFGVTKFDGTVLQQNGDPATQAGTRPFTAWTGFSVTHTMATDFEIPIPTGGLQDIVVKVPAGLVVNPQAYPRCSEDQLSHGGSQTPCPPETQVGVIDVHTPEGDFTAGLYNIAPPYGTPAAFGFNILTNVTHVYAKLRTGDDYGATVITKNIQEFLPIGGVDFTLWGVPADDGHTPERLFQGSFNKGGAPTTVPPNPFLSLPTSCIGEGGVPGGAARTFLDAISWLSLSGSASFLSHNNDLPPNPIGATGCNAVDFSPTLEARPTTNVADSASGLDVDLTIPQNEEECSENPSPPPTLLCNTATAHLKDTTVSLPEGLVINPAGANGLDGCSIGEFGYTSTGEDGTVHTTPDPATCPDASKQGMVEIESPLLDHPLKGSVYLADPYANPFNSLLALYIAVDDAQTGIVAKLAGEVHTDPDTGRISATFKQNPQLPFEHFKLHFFGGAGGPLRTPVLCGNYATTSSMVPWSSPEGETKNPEDNWQITQGANGGACPSSAGAQPNAPSLDAGTVRPIAGAYSPLVVNLRREDGTQNFREVTVTPPPGLVGKLAGVQTCPDSALEAAAGKSGQEEKANPSCPASSRVGVVAVAAGAGPAPYWVQGIAYLTGPYKGAPIGLAIVTPATAGPFDLGTVVVRTALYVDSATAQITAKADPLPSILQGVPLDIRQALIRLDRSQFSLNPTNCDPMAFTGQLISTLGQTASLSSRFQLGECTSLGLKPKMTLSLKGGTKRRGHPGLTATLEPRSGDANLERVSVALPPTELLDQSHIGTVCTRVQFAADQCPAESIYGTATVTTPLVDYPLTGNVYLRSSSNPLPDLVPDFRGPASQPIRLESAGRTDTVKGALRNTFDLVPDAPFTKLVLSLPGGRKGLIQNSTDICAKKYKATVKYVAHNGLSLEQRPVVKTQCPKKRKKQRKRAHRHAVR